MTEEKEITRAQFFRAAFKKSLNAVWDLAENFGGPLERAANLGGQWRVVFTGVVPDDQPKLIFHQGKPYFLLRKDNKIRAFSGLCPNDAILLVAHPTRGFTCSFCAGEFQVDDVNTGKTLTEHPVKVEGETILLALF